MNPTEISKQMDKVTESSIRLVMASTFDTNDKINYIQEIISGYDMIQEVLNVIEVRNDGDEQGIIMGC